MSPDGRLAALSAYPYLVSGEKIIIGFDPTITALFVFAALTLIAANVLRLFFANKAAAKAAAARKADQDRRDAERSAERKSRKDPVESTSDTTKGRKPTAQPRTDGYAIRQQLINQGLIVPAATDQDFAGQQILTPAAAPAVVDDPSI